LCFDDESRRVGRKRSASFFLLVVLSKSTSKQSSFVNLMGLSICRVNSKNDSSKGDVNAKGRQGCVHDKQKKKAEHIEEAMKTAGFPVTAKARAWATVNKAVWRRQEEWVRTWQKRKQGLFKEGRQESWQRSLRRSRLPGRNSAGVRSLRIGN